MLSDYLDHELKAFVDTYVASFLSWDIIVFFHKNPTTKCDLVALAHGLGRQPDEVKREADLLVEKGFLEARGGNYACTRDPELREMAGSFFDALCDREKRLLILTAVLQKR